MINRRSVVTYLVLAFVPAWVLFVLPLAWREAAPSARQLATMIGWSLAMWAPGIAALVAVWRVERQPLASLGLGRFGEGRAYLWAWLIPPLLVLLAGTLTAALRLAPVDWELKVVREALARSPAAETPPLFLIGVQALGALFLAPLFNTLFALGEELGWRGFLLPRLLPLGTWRAMLLSGVIWGVWHWPAILQGHNYPKHPYWGLLLMIGFCILFGTIVGWLYLRARSPWAPALAHGTLNAVAGFPLLFMPQVNMALGGTVTSLVGWVPMLLFLGFLVWRKQLPPPWNPQDSSPVEG